MKRITTAVGIIGLCLAPLGAGMAQDDDGGNIGRVYIVTVKDGQGQAFQDGVKAYFACYGENGGKKSYDVWQSETGRLGRYAFTLGGHKWADFDQLEEASQACNDVFQERFLAHIDKATSEFTTYMEAQSTIKDGEYDVVWVFNFVIKDNRKFMNGISKITAAARESDWGNYAWYNIQAGGRHAGDYILVVAEENFAGFDEDNKPLWEMVAGVHGEEASESIRNDLMNAIEKDWSDIWRRRPDMGYSAGGSE
ncbi:MAG TPA: hypothetical protein VMQ83_12330 [Gammaproteobacteria bacterium]|nr:hypothetical protein [Gammaproteobacteria bacterium]